MQQIESGEFKRLSIRDGKYLYAIVDKPSVSTIALLREKLPKIITSLPFPKSMRWDNFDIMYARPIRWILALYGKSVIQFTLADVISSNYTFGHAQMYPAAITIKHPKYYISKLRKSKVLVSVEERSKSIESQLDSLIAPLNCTIVKREEVVSENLHLSEYPTLALYDFDSQFLELPQELLVSEMTLHQKYFPLKDRNDALLNKFIVCVDKKPTETILQNNKAVLSARLSDGFFLYEQDMKKSLDQFNERLKQLTFHRDLGSMYDKTLRIKKLSETLASFLNQTPPLRAAELCKADLASAVVYEFPELQGTIGKYYAEKNREAEETVTAIEEHWWPLTEGGALPSTHSAAILSLADKLDNLISYSQIGIKATSSKDPYALRRAAISIIRILIEKEWALDLEKITTEKAVLDFILQRMKAILLDYGLKSEEIEAVLTKPSHNIYDIYCRAKALHDFRKVSNQFDMLHSASKRARGQIASQEPKKFNVNLLQEEGEIALSDCLDRIQPKLDDALPRHDYLFAFKVLSELNEPLAIFFDHVHVLADDTKLRDNRIALLQKVFNFTNKLVDFNRI